jgi:glucans biosynthesis protein
MSSIDRRGVLAGIAPFLLALSGQAPNALAAPDKGEGLDLGRAHPFSFDLLRARAQALAKTAYVEAKPPAANVVGAINFDAIQKIRFRPDFALWRQGPGDFPVRFFHLNRFNTLPVALHAVSGDTAQPILYAPRYFDYGEARLGKALPSDLGFSGFRVMNGPGAEIDWLAFQGASYFRSSGAQNQYGASARAIAVNTGLSRPEEFPRFTNFWLEEPAAARATMNVYALLEGPSVTGAYKFEARRGGGVTMDAHGELFIRADIERLGIAPLTSMYWYAKSDRRQNSDWRPEVHDSDGLALWTGKGERIWRPLVNPRATQTNSFLDENPKGFGLLQRDRDFNDYQDDGAFYNRRPGIWVEPRGNWGEGSVQLVEIPTDDETNDNVVAYWRPKAPARKGDRLTFDYRLYWQDLEPFAPASVGRVAATRIGRGGVPGKTTRIDARKFVIDFEGGPLNDMGPRFDVKPIVALSRGTVDNAYVVKIVGANRWRAAFDVAIEGDAPIDMRCYLRLGDKTLSETWLYQYLPPA